VKSGWRIWDWRQKHDPSWSSLAMIPIHRAAWCWKYVPLTTQHRHSLYEVPLPRLGFLDRDSFANVQGLGSLPQVRLERRLGKLPDDVMKGIQRALIFALDLNIALG
jgi:mRNA-degrading endonuclease toxin of MazEF toxin-antitoxin module